MRAGDLVGFALGAVRAHRQRSLLTVVGIAVGIATVVLLTALGEGVRQFVLGEFTQFGTNLLGVFPGKNSTFGGSAGTISTTRPLSLDDAFAIEKLPRVEGVVPMIQGNANIESGTRSRRTNIFGVSGQVPRVWRADVAFGRFLPDTTLAEARSFAVLGAKMHRELFRGENPLGARVRVGTDSFRVIGVMAPKGQMLGFDLDDTMFIPVARAQALFNREGLMEVDVLFRAGERSSQVADDITRLLVARHGQEDFSITTQDKMLEVLGSVIGILTIGVAAIGAISLLVGAVGVGTIMTIAVTERTEEIGLLRAVGARRRDVLGSFLAEAAVLGAVGGSLGVALAALLIGALALAVPALPLRIAWPFAGAALGFSIAIGLLAGLLPAARAAGLDPLAALRAE
jgi:putative ABC transport system permease protein